MTAVAPVRGPLARTSTAPDVVVVDDSASNRRLVQALLVAEGYRVRVEESADAARPYLASANTPTVAIVDWEMPGLSGPELCTALRSGPNAGLLYLILVTARTQRADVVTGLRSGAHDYVTKPFDPSELLARVRIGREMVQLQRDLADRVAELERALSENRTLKGLLPICSYCKNVRDEDNYWQQVDSYLASRTQAELSHGICPDCFSRHFGHLD